MQKQYDVTALGELLIDFTENGVSEQGNVLLEANPGGAPCNVLAMLQKLGKRTAFIGKVGKDQFGRLLKETIELAGIDSRNLVMDEEVNTTLAFVHTDKDGDRDFSFYRNPGADMMLKKFEIQPAVIESSKIFHFGTLSFTHEEVKEATKFAVKCAKEAGIHISFDPNLREPLWKDLEDAKKAMVYGFQNCDILKIADNELQFFTGDTFTGCMLNFVLEKGLDDLTESDLAEMLIFANAGASLITTRRGALRVMPEKEEIREMIHGV